MTVFLRRAVGLCITILFCVPSSKKLFAQTRSALTLQIIIDSAEKHLPIIRQKEFLLKSAEAEITDARHSKLPTVKILEEVTAATSNNLAGVYFPMSTIPSVSGSIRLKSDLRLEAGNTAMLYGEYTLVDFGLTRAKIEQATAYSKVLRSDLERETYLLKWEAGTAYFNLLKYEYQLDIERQNLNRYLDIYKVIKSLTESGLRPGADSSQLIAELSKTRVSFNLTEAKVADLKQTLHYYTGISLEDIVIDSSLSKMPVYSPPLFDTSKIFASNPFVNYIAAQRAYNTRTLSLIRKSFDPKIILLGGLWARGSSIQYNDNYKSVLTGLGYQRYNYASGLSFVYNLSDAIHKKDKTSIYDYKIKASESELQQQQALILNELQQTSDILLATQKNLLEMPIQLEAAKSVYAQKLAQYNAGIINLIDLTNASYVLYRAQTDYAELLNELYITSLNKAGYSGSIDQFIQTIKK